jgi:hypothetical protein
MPAAATCRDDRRELLALNEYHGEGATAGRARNRHPGLDHVDRRSAACGQQMPYQLQSSGYLPRRTRTAETQFPSRHHGYVDPKSIAGFEALPPRGDNSDGSLPPAHNANTSLPSLCFLPLPLFSPKGADGFQSHKQQSRPSQPRRSIRLRLADITGRA